MSSLDKLLEVAETKSVTAEQSVTIALRKLAANKDLRTFLTALLKYSKADWAGMIRSLKLLYQVLQSSILIQKDSPILNEISRMPHIAAFFRRLNESDVD